MNLQSGSIFIELAGIVVGSVLTIPLIDDDVEMKLLVADVVEDATPPIKDAVDPDEDDSNKSNNKSAKQETKQNNRQEFTLEAMMTSLIVPQVKWAYA